MNQDIHQLMQDAIKQGVFPAAELLIAQQQTIVHHQHYGHARENMFFDLASLTKPLCIATRTQQLVDDGTLTWDAPLSALSERFEQSNYARATLEQLINHRAGFPAWEPFYKALQPELAGSPEAREYILQHCAQTPLAYTIGESRIYSDLGYLLWGDVLEIIDGRPLATQFTDNIAAPHNLHSLHFRPLATRDTQTDVQCHPTEHCPWRGRIVQGTVHDYHAYALGGVAGNAGLFGNALDIYQLMTNGPAIPEHGWDQPSAQGSSTGNHFSKDSIGHLGFTGCSIWRDPHAELLVVLLSNRIHPSCDNELIKTFRPTLHDIAHQSFAS